jgi:hypothetical protein
MNKAKAAVASALVRQRRRHIRETCILTATIQSRMFLDLTERGEWLNDHEGPEED